MDHRKLPCTQPGHMGKSPTGPLEWHPFLLEPIVPLVPMDHRKFALYPARSHGKIIKVPLMRCIFTNRTTGKVPMDHTIGTNGPSVWRIVSVCVYWTCVKKLWIKWETNIAHFDRKPFQYRSLTQAMKMRNNWREIYHSVFEWTSPIAIAATCFPSFPSWSRGDEWSIKTFNCSQNFTFARFARKI